MSNSASIKTTCPEEGITAWVGLGANLGNARKTLLAALKALDKHPQVSIKKTSSFYRTAPVDATGPDFMNAAVCLQTTLQPLELLHLLQNIELKFGRERPYHHAPRTLDLDLLLYSEMVLNTPELTLPHPAMHERAFVLVPLAELNGDLTIPFKGNVKDLLGTVKGQGVERVKDA